MHVYAHLLPGTPPLRMDIGLRVGGGTAAADDPCGAAPVGVALPPEPATGPWGLGWRRYPNAALSGHPLAEVTVSSLKGCAVACLEKEGCRSADMDFETGRCAMHNATKDSFGRFLNLLPDTLADHLQRV
eukprot:Polyplicarium_translucidae@DN5183_c0_g1_i1.p2